MAVCNGPLHDAPNLAVIDSVTQFVNGTQAVWNTITLPVPPGILVYATDTTAVKLGNGVSLYADLPVLFTVSAIATLGQELLTISGELPGMATQAWVTNLLDQAISNLSVAVSAGITAAQLQSYIAAAVSGFATLADLAAQLVSPAFTGTPTAPTPPVGDVSTAIATTQAIANASGNFAGVVSITASTVLTAANAGWLVSDDTSGLPIALTLPAHSTMRNGGAITFHSNNVNGCSVNCAGTDVILVGGLAGATTTATIPLGVGDTLTVVAGPSAWHAQNGTAQLQYTNRVRVRPLRPISFYVNAATGNDVTGDGSSARPWASLDQPWIYAQDSLDLSQVTVTVNCTGHFTTGLAVSGALTGCVGPANFIYDGGGTATLSTTGSHGFYGSNGAQFTVQNWGLCTAVGTILHSSPVVLIASSAGTIINFSNIDFGAAASWQIVGDRNGRAAAVGDFTICGGGQASFTGQGGGIVDVSYRNITVTNMPEFTVGFVYSYLAGVVLVMGSVFKNAAGATTASGAIVATGPRYYLGSSGCLNTLGADAYLPGNAAGVLAGGYVL